MKVLIPSTTQAVSKLVQVDSDEYLSFGQVGLSGAEAITFQVDMDGWKDIVPTIALTVDNNYIQVAGPGTYLLVKPITAAPTGVYLSE